MSRSKFSLNSVKYALSWPITWVALSLGMATGPLLIIFALLGFVVRSLRYKSPYLDVVWLTIGCGISTVLIFNTYFSEKFFDISNYNTFLWFCICVFILYLSELWNAPAKKLERTNDRTRTRRS